MGSGIWTADSFAEYSTSMGRSLSKSSSTGYVTLDSSYSAQDIYTSHTLNEELNPYKVNRECVDTKEHPNTIPVILALDVTGSMGQGAVEVAKKLNEIMMLLYTKIRDVEFCIMGIGDIAYDSAPIQISQFESDIRIAEHLDKIYFEHGGGGNIYESYTAAWYMGLHHTSLDAWKRNRRGIIITMGDECINPVLNKGELTHFVGDSLQADIETTDLYPETINKFDIYHLSVDDKYTSYHYNKDRIDNSWQKYLDNKHYIVVNINNIANTIVNIIENSIINDSTDSNIYVPNENTNSGINVNEFGEITW